jgi:protein disulfide-isomerase-like protein
LEKALKLANTIASAYVKPKHDTNPDGQVVHLTDKTFPVLTNNSAWLVMFHAPWCGHCKNLAPTWEQLAKSLKGQMNVGKVDCTTETAVARKYQIRGYPTLKFLKEPAGVVEYRGRRSLDTLKEFAASFLK